LRRSHVMSGSNIILLSMAALLAAYLSLRHWRKVRRRPAERHWPGHGIDVAGITDRVQGVRSDFAAELQSRTHETCYRRGLLASARRTVRELAYFRRRAGQGSAEREHEALHTIMLLGVALLIGGQPGAAQNSLAASGGPPRTRGDSFLGSILGYPDDLNHDQAASTE
jgi:hypothetical protein